MTKCAIKRGQAVNLADLIEPLSKYRKPRVVGGLKTRAQREAVTYKDMPGTVTVQQCLDYAAHYLGSAVCSAAKHKVMEETPRGPMWTVPCKRCLSWALQEVHGDFTFGPDAIIPKRRRRAK